MACLIESVVAGSTDPSRIRRGTIAKLLRRTPALRARIEAKKSTSEGLTVFGIEPDRIGNVVRKLARGHAAFELSRIVRQDPTSIWWKVLPSMTDEERDDFEACHVVGLFGEVGSRGMQRLIVAQVVLESAAGRQNVGLVVQDWVDVQEGRYRYLAIDDGGQTTVRIVIGEYLACQVTWAQ